MINSKLAALSLAGILIVGASPAGAQMSESNAMASHAATIVDVAVANGSFTTLVTALKAANLVGALQGSGPFTVFAPTDAAFAKLPAGTLDALLKDPNKLAAILKFHVITGKVMAGDVIKAGGAKPKTLNGASLDITIRDGKVYVDGAQVVTADVAASNGVIHVIDTVLLPKTK